jgi:hypothetical protein
MMVIVEYDLAEDEFSGFYGKRRFMKTWRPYYYLIYFIVLVLCLVLYDYFSSKWLNWIDSGVKSWIDDIVKALISGLFIFFVNWYRIKGKRDKS